jgi:ubiquinone/menaquinone biosynthesis C-methylase UbiE
LTSDSGPPLKPTETWSWVDDFILQVWEKWKGDTKENDRGKQTSFVVETNDDEELRKKLVLLADEMHHLTLYDGTPVGAILEITKPTDDMKSALFEPEYPLQHYLFTLKGEKGKLALSKLEELEQLKSEYYAKEKDRPRDRIELLMNLARELGFNFDKETTILDFGCGDGRYVYWLRKMGLKAFGVDIANQYELSLGQLRKEGIASYGSEVFKLIDSDLYRIPFPDCQFDFVYSDQVFEHVHDYEQAVSEIFRVLKPGGLSVHIFPSRYRIIECHTYVPFATIFRGLNYLRFWALMGIRNPYQRRLGSAETARRNFAYLHERTNYLSERELRVRFSKVFGDVAFVEEQFATFHKAIPRYLYEAARATRTLALLAFMISTFGSRVVCLRKN